MFWKKKASESVKDTKEPKKKAYTTGGWVNLLGTDKAKEDYATTWVSTGIHIRNKNLANGNIYMYEKRGDDVEEVTEHEFLNIIQNKNIYGQTFYKLMYLIGANLDVYGKCFLYVVPDIKGRPSNFIILPTRTSIVLNPEKTEIDHYELRLNSGGKQSYKKDEIILFTLPSIDVPYGGTATINSCRHLINIDNYRQLLQEKYLLTGGAINMVLESDVALSEENRDRLKELMRERQNIDNTDAFLILEEGLKSKDIQTSAKELDFANSSNSIRDEILGKLEVPKVLLGLAESANKASAEVAVFSFIKNVIRPFSRFVIDEFDSWVKIKYGKQYLLKIEWDDFKDISEQTQMIDMLLRHNAISINEAREAFGWGQMTEAEDTPKINRN